MRITKHAIFCYLLLEAGRLLTKQDLLLGAHIFLGRSVSSFKPKSNTCYFMNSAGPYSNPKQSTVIKGWIGRSGKKGRFNLYDLTDEGRKAALFLQEFLTAPPL